MEKLNYPELVPKILTESFLGEDISPDTENETALPFFPPQKLKSFLHDSN